MASLNKVLLIGNLGADPEVRYTAGGAAVANFRIATSEVWNDKNGEKQERTEWHRIVVWGRQAEHCGEYLRKGRSVLVEGRIQTREWADRDGQKRFTTEIIAQSVTFLGSRGDGGGGSDYPRGDAGPSPRGRGDGYPRREERASADNRGGPGGGMDFGGEDAPPIEDGDIPF